jgi:hypothetical protein
MQKLLVLMCLAEFCFGMPADDIGQYKKECDGRNATSCGIISNL